MGILSNATLQKRIGDVIIKYTNFACVAVYIIGIIWFCLLSTKPFNASTYFSENALLPGLVQRDFLSDRETKQYYDDMQARLANLTDESERKRIVFSYIREKFINLGLSTAEQNFSFQYPMKLRSNPVIGNNIYGILRAPRLPGTEAIVMNVPYENDRSGNSVAGIALLLGLASTFRRHTYWAKDLIFLFTDFEASGIQAWTAAYHGNFHEYQRYLSFGELQERSGAIQAAIVLELNTNSISRFNIKYEGYNGQLPNLDLVNTAIHLCKHEGIPPTIQKRLDAKHDDELLSTHSLVTLLSMLSNQITGSSTGNHGFFQKYHIEAITLQGVKMKNAKRNVNFAEMGRVIEGIIRSVNNLLERFHQSFFFYLLPATDRYISIGLYMPPFGLMIAAALLKAIALWIAIVREESESNENQPSSSDTKGEESSNESRAETAEPNKEQETKHRNNEKSDIAEVKQQNQHSVIRILPLLLISVLFGIAAYHLPKHSIPMAAVFFVTPSTGLALGALAIQTVACMYPVIMLRKGKEINVRLFPDWRLQKCIALLAFGVSTFAVSIMNISLGVFVTVVWSPLFLFVRPVTNRAIRVIQCITMLLLTPLALLLLVCIGSILLFDSNTSYDAVLLQALTKFSNSLLRSVIEDYMYGNWTFGVCSQIYFPIWLLFWSLLWSPVNSVNLK